MNREDFKTLIELIQTNKKTAIASAVSGIATAGLIYYLPSESEDTIEEYLKIATSIVVGLGSATIPITIRLAYEIHKYEKN